MQHTNNNTTYYLVRFFNDQTVNEVCTGSLIKSGVQEQGMKILYPLHTTGLDTLMEDGNKEAETAGEEILCAIIYLENSDKARFSDLQKHVNNDYVLNK